MWFHFQSPKQYDLFYVLFELLLFCIVITAFIIIINVSVTSEKKNTCELITNIDNAINNVRHSEATCCSYRVIIEALRISFQ